MDCGGSATHPAPDAHNPATPRRPPGVPLAPVPVAMSARDDRRRVGTGLLSSLRSHPCGHPPGMNAGLPLSSSLAH